MPFIAGVLGAITLFVVGCADAPDRLTMRDDGTFTIVQFTDTHFNTADSLDEPTYALMRLVIDTDRPDLIVLTGDIARLYPPDSTSVYAEIAKETWPLLIAFLDSTGVPWTFTHGNHDAELTTHGHLDTVIATSRNTLYMPGPADVDGHGNHVLPVYQRDDGIGAVLWFLDSGAYGSEPSGYGWIRPSQIAWFERESARLRHESGPAAPGIAFFHIPLQQYDTAWNTLPCLGVKQERVCMQGRDTGMFDAFKRNGVAAVYCGHDHVNDYSCELDGVTLAYGRGTGYRPYGKEGFQRGARVVVLTDDGRGRRSYIRLADGSIAEQPLHEPEDVVEVAE